MTIANENRKDTYSGNGATTLFNYNFKIFKQSELKVTLRNTLGVEVTLALATHYSISGAGNPSGSITMITSPAIGETLTITRNIIYDQQTDLRNQGAWLPEVVEDEFDKSRMIDLQQREELDRSLKFPVSTSVTDFEFPDSPSPALKLTRYKADGKSLELVTPADVGFTTMITPVLKQGSPIYGVSPTTFGQVDSVKYCGAYADFETAVAAIGAAVSTLVITELEVVSNNVLVPSNLSLVFQGQGQLSINTGVTVTVIPSASLWERRSLFLGAGVVSGLDISCPEWFGAVGDGVTDDFSAILAASKASKTVYFTSPSGYSVGSSFSFDSTFLGLSWKGPGRSYGKIIKGFNGDLITATNVQHFSVDDLFIDGKFGTHTGKCFVIAGNAGSFPYFSNVITCGFSDNHYDFAADAGKYATMQGIQCLVGSGQGVITQFKTSADSGAMIRRISNASFQGDLDFSGSLDTYITGSQFGKIITDTSCKYFANSCRWGNSGGAMTINGNGMIGECSFSGDVTLSSNFTGSFLGNEQSAGSFTDNSISGNAVIIHHPLATGHYLIGKNSLSIGGTVGQEFLLNSIISVGDANISFVADANQSTFLYANNLTAARTVTLETTNSRNGMRVRVTRPGGDIGGPWQLTIGSTGKMLSAGQWCDVDFNGTMWRVIAFGTLP